MAATVFLMDFRAGLQNNLMVKLEKLLATAGLEEVVRPRDMVAIKLHFGETGNNAYIRPAFLRTIVSAVKKADGIPFLTDANTLYSGTRGNALHHLTTAIHNGFAYSVVEAPLVIADGLRGRSETAVPISGKHIDKAYIGKEIVEADVLLSVAHFKGHELAGFGGTLKNVGMGSASRRGKLAMHSTVSPKVHAEECVGCGECVQRCSQEALSLVNDVAVMDEARCIGCGECILNCPNNAIRTELDQELPDFMEGIVEYCCGVLKNKSGRALFVNFINNVSPACDCFPANDAPIVKNIGVAASRDPVALDQASVDLVNAEAALPGTCLTVNTEAGGDKFKGLYPKVEWGIQLAYAEQMGLGTRTYELVRV
jgi:uncharacterized Fe-S center protein